MEAKISHSDGDIAVEPIFEIAATAIFDFLGIEFVMAKWLQPESPG